jgi:hypothetical protein
MNIEPTSRDFILRQIEREFRFHGSNDAMKIGVIDEHLRATCLLSDLGETDENPHSLSPIKLCRQVYRRVKPLFPDLDSNLTQIAEELSSLDKIGDIIKVDSTHVISGPARRIELSSTSSLLVGGGPVGALPLRIQNKLEIAGRSRIISGQLEDLIAIEFPFQRLEDFLELEADDMLAWAENYIADKLRNSNIESPPDDLQLWTSNRWIQFNDYSGESDICLARREIISFGRIQFEYSLLRLRIKNKIKKIDAFVELDKSDARKLQGAIRSGSCGFEKVFFSKLSENSIEVVVPHPITDGKSKLLLLGWESSIRENSKPWPKKFEFSEKLTPLLTRGFRLMGYELIKK